MTRFFNKALVKCTAQVSFLCVAIIALMGAGDEATRFNELGHRMMCVCGCGQILLECNHVGCTYSDGMRNELIASLGRGDSDDLAMQGFVQKYGPAVLAAPAKAGFNWVAWVMPFLALALGLATTVLIARTWRKRPLPVAPGGVMPVSGVELERFREQAREETKL